MPPKKTDKIPVRVPGLPEPVLFPRSMSEQEIQQVLETEILPGLRAAQTPPSLGGEPQVPPAAPGFRGLIPGLARKVTQPFVEMALGSERFPLPGGAQVPEEFRGLVQGAAETGVKMAPGLVAGAMTGGASLPVMAGAQGGAAALGQALGLEEPSIAQVGWATGLPLAFSGAVRTGSAAFRWLAKNMPGAAGALHEEAAAVARQTPELIRLGSRSSGELEAILNRMDPQIPAEHLRKVAADLFQKEVQKSAGTKSTEILRAAEGYVQDVQGRGGLVPFQWLREELKGLNAKIGGASGTEQGAYKLLKRTIMETLEEAGEKHDAARPAVAALKEWVKTFKGESAREELAEMVRKGITLQPETNAVMVNAKQMLQAVQRDTLFRRGLPPEDLAAIERTLTELNRIPKLPAPASAERGSGRGLVSAVFGVGTGSAAGLYTGNPFAAGLVGSMTFGAAQAMQRLLMSEPGRKTLLGIIRRTGPVLSPETIAVLSVAARQIELDLAGAAGPAERVSIGPEARQLAGRPATLRGALIAEPSP